jgi:hypothetical protein
MLLENSKLLYNVFVVDGLPYCDICIKKMGMIRLGEKSLKVFKLNYVPTVVLLLI